MTDTLTIGSFKWKLLEKQPLKAVLNKRYYQNLSRQVRIFTSHFLSNYVHTSICFESKIETSENHASHTSLLPKN